MREMQENPHKTVIDMTDWSTLSYLNTYAAC